VPSTLIIPFRAITAFVDPAVDFGLQFQAADDLDEEGHEDAENDSSALDGETSDKPAVERSDDGSNVVTVDFGRKK
jgi:hypothetical protein